MITKLKQLQKQVYVQHFETEILPYLKDNDLIYYGMGIHGVDGNEDYDYLPSDLEDKVIQLLEQIQPFYNKQLDPVYIYLEMLDSPTNIESMKTNECECEKICIKDYKRTHKM